MKNQKRNFMIIMSVVFGVVVLIFIVGRLGFFSHDETSKNYSPNLKTGSPKLDSRLNQLIQSNNREQFAQTNGLKMKDGKVQVRINTTSNSYKLPAKFGDEGSSYLNLHDAYVVVDSLPELALDPQIVNISVPSYPVGQ